MSFFNYYFPQKLKFLKKQSDLDNVNEKTLSKLFYIQKFFVFSIYSLFELLLVFFCFSKVKKNEPNFLLKKLILIIG